MSDATSDKPQPVVEVIHCKNCGGTGCISLLTSSRVCLACAGKGKTRRITTTFHDDKGRVRAVAHTYPDMPPPTYSEYTTCPTQDDDAPYSRAG